MNIREITDCTDDTEMKSKFDAYVEWLKTNAEDPAHRTPEGALQLAHNNVGYFAGYYGFDKMAQVKRVLGAEHPVLAGAIRDPLDSTLLTTSLSKSCSFCGCPIDRGAPRWVHLWLPDDGREPKILHQHRACRCITDGLS